MCFFSLTDKEKPLDSYRIIKWTSELQSEANSSPPSKSEINIVSVIRQCGARGGVVVKAVRYKPAGRVFDSRWCHWNFSVT